MTTPICDFVKKYVKQQSVRLHMPGHKGINLLGCEEYDITEINGADSLYEAAGIIAQSEANASALFGCDTFYSAEGSSQCIRAMLHLASLHSGQKGKRPVVMAARNAHKTFLSGAALEDMDVIWLYGDKTQSYLRCDISAEYVDKMLSKAGQKPVAVYLTSPDYLGNTADIQAIAQVCHRHGVLLVVDNAHGAYLKFLPCSQHPIDLGADICCDSAHKTLPVLTGGAYLHISSSVSQKLSPMAKNALALFGSTSPSYVIMQSLDMANEYISDGYGEKLAEFCKKAERIKLILRQKGFEITGNEPLKVTISTKSYGYKGTEIAEMLENKNIICEFSDRDFTVFMLTPELSDEQLELFVEALCSIPKREAVKEKIPQISMAKKVMTIREAMFSAAEEIATEKAVGRVLAAASVGCPPAVPVVVCGEEIDADALENFRYYGIDKCWVVTE